MLDRSKSAKAIREKCLVRTTQGRAKQKEGQGSISHFIRENMTSDGKLTGGSTSRSLAGGQGESH